jgi:hypothetical protein
MLSTMLSASGLPENDLATRGAAESIGLVSVG